jgi:hypothetical protein
MCNTIYLRDRIHNRGKKGISYLAIGLFIIVCLMPTLQGNLEFQPNDIPDNQKYISLHRCYFLIYGRISNPIIKEYKQYKWLWIHAECVHVIGFGVSYDGLYSITQWIYDEDVKLSLEADGPTFRGLVTNNFILGRQIARYF